MSSTKAEFASAIRLKDFPKDLFIQRVLDDSTIGNFAVDLMINHNLDSSNKCNSTQVEKEIRDKDLSIPTLTGSFGITWEEWTAHLAGPTRDFRQASRLLVHAQAQYALDWLSDRADEKTEQEIMTFSRPFTSVLV